MKGLRRKKPPAVTTKSHAEGQIDQIIKFFLIENKTRMDHTVAQEINLG